VPNGMFADEQAIGGLREWHGLENENTLDWQGNKSSRAGKVQRIADQTAEIGDQNTPAGFT